MKDLKQINFNGMELNIKADEWKKVTPENQQTIMDFDRYNSRNNLKDSSRKNNIASIVRFGKTINKPFSKVTKQDINDYFDNLNIGKCAKGGYLMVLRKLYKWLLDDNNPGIFSDFKSIQIKGKELRKSDLLTENEIRKVVSSYENPCMKSYVSVLFDTACRPSELINLRRKHVTNQNGLWTISISGKTGTRNLGLSSSAPHFEQWYNSYHPDRDNPDSFVWLNRNGKPYTVNYSWKIIKRGEKIINKRLFPYLCRHSRLTDLADELVSEMEDWLYESIESKENQKCVIGIVNKDGWSDTWELEIEVKKQ